ncbi:MAG: hypothetical protein MZW92_47125 [Comamonadaceae bacterium]|nr:hypothetical protein [Comamonadaceae bacterium]
MTQRMMDYAKARGRLDRHRSSSTRSTRREASHLTRLLAEIQATLRQGLPAAEPAGRRRHARRRLLLQPRRQAATSARSADAHRAIVDQVVEVDERADGRLLPRTTATIDAERAARPVRAGAARGPPDSGRASSRRETGAGVRRTARRARASCCRTRPRATRRRSSRARATRRVRDERRARPGEARAGARVQGHRSTRSSARWASSASTRARCSQDAQLLRRRRPQAVQGRRTCSMLQGKEHVEVAARAAGRHRARWPRSTRLHFDAVLHDSHDEDHHPPEAARLPAADARPGDPRRAARRRAAAVGRSCTA